MAICFTDVNTDLGGEEWLGAIRVSGWVSGCLPIVEVNAGLVLILAPRHVDVSFA